MNFDVLDLTARLVQTPSVNPMGGPDEGPEYYEGRLTDQLEEILRPLPVTIERHTVAPGRDNLFARLEGKAPGDRLIVLDTHQDTVPVTGMTVDPYGGEVREGRLYGRGACDEKGSMAAMIAALARLAEDRIESRPTVVLSCTVNEEFGFSGAKQLRELWTAGTSPLFPRRPDAVIVAEPTELNVIVAHKGVLRWHCRAVGKAAHGCKPHLGKSAIYRMGHVLVELERYASEVLPTLAAHPLVGPPTLNVGTVHGGLGDNMVPPECEIVIDRRTLPEETLEGARQQVIDHVYQALGGSDSEASRHVVHDPPYQAFMGLSDAHNGPLAQRMLAIAQEAGQTCKIDGVPYGTNAIHLGADAVPCVVFGPGSIDQAHTADEWIELDQLRRGAELFYRFAKGLA